MRDSYNDFCYRQRENCEGCDRRDNRLCAHAHRWRVPPREKRESNQGDATEADVSYDARRVHGRRHASSASRRARYRYAQNFV